MWTAVFILYFNSKVVRLKALDHSPKLLSVFYCNSKVVRLKVPQQREKRKEIRFQFQSGAVKRLRFFHCFPLFCCISIPKWCG